MAKQAQKTGKSTNRLRRLLLLGPHTCPWWFGWTFDNPLRRRVHDAEAMLQPFVSRGDTVLDIGCGGGFFTIGLARLVGAEGKVIATDIQPRMIARARRRVEGLGLGDRVDFRLCAQDELGVGESLDFALAFWVIHEVLDPEKLLRDLSRRLKPDAPLFIVEPKGHVSKARFETSAELARNTGYQVREGPAVRFSRTVLCSPDG